MTSVYSLIRLAKEWSCIQIGLYLELFRKEVESSWLSYHYLHLISSRVGLKIFAFLAKPL